MLKIKLLLIIKMDLLSVCKGRLIIFNKKCCLMSRVGLIRAMLARNLSRIRMEIAAFYLLPRLGQY